MALTAITLWHFDAVGARPSTSSGMKERGGETERQLYAQATARFLDSTELAGRIKKWSAKHAAHMVRVVTTQCNRIVAGAQAILQ